MFYLVVGNCGVGKTWVMQQIIKEYEINTLGKVGTILYHRNHDIIVLGKYDGSMYQGSDRLSMAVMKDLDEFIIRSEGYDVICEGDRFTNKTFINKAKPHIVKILGDGSAGRESRGSKQSEGHIKRISTRVQNIDEDYLASDSLDCYNYLLHRLSGK